MTLARDRDRAPLGALRPSWVRPCAFGAAAAAHLFLSALFLLSAPEPLIAAADAFDVAFVQEGDAIQEAKASTAPDEQAETAEPTVAQAAAEAQQEEAPRVTRADAPPPLAQEKPEVAAPDAPTVALDERPREDSSKPNMKPQRNEPTAQAALEEVEDAHGDVRRVAVAAAEAIAPSAAAADHAGATDGRRVANSASRAHYGARVLQEIQRHMFYPPQARSANVTGQAVVIFTVGAEGRVTERQIYRSTGDERLDHAALAMLDAVKAPPPPAGRFNGRTTIKFDIKR